MPLYLVLPPLVRNVTFWASMLQASCVADMKLLLTDAPTYRTYSGKQVNILGTVMATDISTMCHQAVTDQEGHATGGKYLTRRGMVTTIRGTSERANAKTTTLRVKDSGPD